MSHPEIACPPALALEMLSLFSEEAEPVAVYLVSANYVLGPSGEVDATKPVPVNIGGEYWGEPEKSSVRYEAQIAFTKPATDVVLIGHAYSVGRSETSVSFTIGSLCQRARVTGDRYWMRVLGTPIASAPEPFERIPLIYERCFGGWDRSDPDPARHTFEPRNPVGTGFRLRRGAFEEGVRLPNIEEYNSPSAGYAERRAPVGFGFVSAGWEPRAGRAGTYDREWEKNRMPCLPRDFDRSFFNAASLGLVSLRPIEGGEQVIVENATPGGFLRFGMPNTRPPVCRIRTHSRGRSTVDTKLDTVIVDTDEMTLMLIWRGYHPARRGLLDVAAIEVGTHA